MAGMMIGDVVQVESSGSLPLDSIVSEGVQQKPDIDALAVASDHKISVMIWNYHDDDVAAAPSDIRLAISGIPVRTRRVVLRHYRIDANHSNAFTVWKELGSPQNPTPEQYAKLETAGQLQLLESPSRISAQNGSSDLSFSLPRQGISLVELSW
jgi:xylan 1,4-beta-xylosidase